MSDFNTLVVPTRRLPVRPLIAGSAFAPDNRLPVLRSTDLRTGDLLCFRGSHPVSAAIRDIDGCDFDHPAMVMSVDGDTVIFAEQNFDGFRTARLEDYDDLPEAVLVRRPRTPIEHDTIVAAVEQFGASRPAYAWHRLVDIVLVSLVRCTPMFEAYDEERRARLAERMDLLFAMGATTVGLRDTALCVDMMLAAFDRQEPGPNGRAWTIVIPTRQVGSVDDWRNALHRFLDLLDQYSGQGVNPLHHLRRIVTDRRPGDLQVALAACTERYLLERFLMQRFIPTPADMVFSPSFVDVGLLHPSLYRTDELVG